MYQNIYYDRFNEEIHLWDDLAGYHCFPYKRYAYIEDDNGEYLTMHGKRVRKTDRWSDSSEKLGIVYEHDVRPEMRTLIDLYEDSDDISTNHCIFYFDIEVERGTRHSPPEEAKNKITSIAFYDSVQKKYACFILDGGNRISDSVVDGVTVVTFSSEYDMLMAFIEVWNTTPITIVTGWNVLWFDLVYLYNRIERVIGKFKGKFLSPIRKVDSYVSRRGEKVFKIAGISILDYMELYKTLVPSERPSYTLDAISNYELGRGKVSYEKDLDHLYATDPIKFIQYNIEDVKLVVDLNEKLDFIGIAQGACHSGHVPYEDIFMTSRYMEGACLTETRRRGIVAINNRVLNHSGEKATGAFVKRSRPGLYSWVYDLDLTSLYPSNIMSLNISPETKRGKISDWNSEDFIHEADREFEVILFNDVSDVDVHKIHASQFRQFLNDNNLSVSANGILYTLSTQGLIPSLLDTWFDVRAKYRKISNTAHANGDIDTYKFYDRKQKIQKVMLNSLYGVLLLPTFRFYDKDNGEAVTVTGQQLIHFTTTTANFFYNYTIGTKDIDYCLYTDTDSVFYESMPIITHRYGNVPEDDIPELTIQVATEVQNWINNAYDMYARTYHNLNSHRWNIKQELVAKRAFWGSAKKRYAMWIVRDGSNVVDKADIKGFDSVRSSFPKIFRKFLESIIIDILHDKSPGELNQKVIEFKNDLENYSITDIMNPVGAKDMEKWKPDSNTTYKSKTPIHIKSAINYNRFLADNNLLKVPQIASGDKIIWAYLKDNPYNFDTIALRGYDDPDEAIEFVNRFANRDKMFDRAMEEKLSTVWGDLGWGSVVMNKNVSKFFEFIDE